MLKVQKNGDSNVRREEKTKKKRHFSWNGPMGFPYNEHKFNILSIINIRYIVYVTHSALKWSQSCQLPNWCPRSFFDISQHPSVVRQMTPFHVGSLRRLSWRICKHSGTVVWYLTSIASSLDMSLPSPRNLYPRYMNNGYPRYTTSVSTFSTLPSTRPRRESTRVICESTPATW